MAVFWSGRGGGAGLRDPGAEESGTPPPVGRRRWGEQVKGSTAQTGHAESGTVERAKWCAIGHGGRLHPGRHQGHVPSLGCIGGQAQTRQYQRVYSPKGSAQEGLH